MLWEEYLRTTRDMQYSTASKGRIISPGPERQRKRGFLKTGDTEPMLRGPPYRNLWRRDLASGDSAGNKLGGKFPDHIVRCWFPKDTGVL